MTVERTLARLQRVVRLGEQPHDSSPPPYWGRVPDDVADDDGLALTVAEYRLMLRAIAEIRDDLRFEHLEERRAKDAVWRFICMATLRRDEDHVAPFVRDHGLEPKDTVCYFPLEHLAVKERFELGDATFMPKDDPEVPSGRFVPFPPPCDGIVAVPVSGTSGTRMKERAEAAARHALRLLRVAAHEDRVIHDRQLRFRLGSVYAFRDGGEGWSIQDDAAFDVTLDGQLRDLVLRQPISGLPRHPWTDVEKRAITALDWFDRARLATDDLVRTLYDFFALEALLGDKSERLKGLALTFRRSMLSLAVHGHFSNPHALFYMYDEVRSGAVHGEALKSVDEREHRIFDWNARMAINEYLTFAGERGLTKRSQFIEALEAHPDAPRLLESLRRQDERWLGYEPGGRSPATRRGTSRLGRIWAAVRRKVSGNDGKRRRDRGHARVAPVRE